MQFSKIKNIKTELENLVCDWREPFENMINEEKDFEVENYRFIKRDEIDEIQQGELRSDTFLLGCFDANFLSDIADLSIEIIEALQECLKHEALGEHCLSYVEEIQDAYSSADGYGHHFAHYDHNEHEIDFKDGDGDFIEYYAFRIK